VVRDRGSLQPDPDRAERMMIRAGECGVAVLGAAGAGRNVVRIAPPLLITDDELERDSPHSPQQRRSSWSEVGSPGVIHRRFVARRATVSA
jgi:hypothetical protein